MPTTFKKWLAIAGTTLIAMPSPPAAAQGDVGPFSSAYSVAFGSGVYQLSDGTEVQIYRANFSVALRDAPATPGSGPGVRLLLPVAIGRRISDDELPEVESSSPAIDVAAFLPGVELEQRVGERWTLRTRAQLGRAEEREGTEQSARIATLGFRSRVDLESVPGNPALLAGFLWTGFDPSEGEKRSLLRVSAGVEFDIPAARWEVRDSPMSWRPHVLKDWYYRPAPTLGFGDDDVERRAEEWQLGIAAAREEGFKILRWNIEAVGIAYRFSDHSSGWRVYLNSVF